MALTGDLPDQLEIPVVVQHGEPGAFRNSRDHQVGDLPTPQSRVGLADMMYGDGATLRTLIDTPPAGG